MMATGMTILGESLAEQGTIGPGGAQALSQMGQGIAVRLQHRWWQQEAEDFQKGPGQKFQEDSKALKTQLELQFEELSKIKDPAQYRAFERQMHQTIMMQQADVDAEFFDAASKYQTNPYISQQSAALYESRQGMTAKLIERDTAVSTAQAARLDAPAAEADIEYKKALTRGAGAQADQVGRVGFYDDLDPADLQESGAEWEDAVVTTSGGQQALDTEMARIADEEYLSEVTRDWQAIQREKMDFNEFRNKHGIDDMDFGTKDQATQLDLIMRAKANELKPKALENLKRRARNRMRRKGRIAGPVGGGAPGEAAPSIGAPPAPAPTPAPTPEPLTRSEIARLPKEERVAAIRARSAEVEAAEHERRVQVRAQQVAEMGHDEIARSLSQDNYAFEKRMAKNLNLDTDILMEAEISPKRRAKVFQDAQDESDTTWAMVQARAEERGEEPPPRWSVGTMNWAIGWLGDQVEELIDTMNPQRFERAIEAVERGGFERDMYQRITAVLAMPADTPDRDKAMHVHMIKLTEQWNNNSKQKMKPWDLAQWAAQYEAGGKQRRSPSRLIRKHKSE
jgi:hypothetical protein